MPSPPRSPRATPCSSPTRWTISSSSSPPSGTRSKRKSTRPTPRPSTSTTSSSPWPESRRSWRPTSPSAPAYGVVRSSMRSRWSALRLPSSSPRPVRSSWESSPSAHGATPRKEREELSKYEESHPRSRSRKPISPVPSPSPTSSTSWLISCPERRARLPERKKSARSCPMRPSTIIVRYEVVCVSQQVASRQSDASHANGSSDWLSHASEPAAASESQ